MPTSVSTVYVGRDGQSIYFFCSPSTTPLIPARITAIVSNPTATLNGSPVALEGPWGISVGSQIPYVIYRLAAAVAPTDVIAYSAAAGWLTTSSGGAGAASGVPVSNYVGQYEPPVYGYPAFNAAPSTRTMRVGMNLSGPNFGSGSYSQWTQNWLTRANNPLSGAITSAIGGQPLTIKGTASSFFANYAGGNGVDLLATPDETGVWTRIIDDTNPANMMTCGFICSNGQATVTPLGSGGLVDPGTLVGGVQVGRVWQWNVQRIASPTKNNLALTVTTTRPGVSGTYPYTLTNEVMFSPLATTAALPGFPSRSGANGAEQSLLNWLTAPSGKCVGALRTMDSAARYGGFTQIVDVSDLKSPTDYSWGSQPGNIAATPTKTRTLTIAKVRTYAPLGAAGFPVGWGITWSSPNVYINAWHRPAGQGYAIDSVLVSDQGSSYVAPVATATGGGGSGCTLGTPVLSSGRITSIPVTAAGSGYTTPPTITITDGSGSGATATAIVAIPVTDPAFMDATSGHNTTHALEIVFTTPHNLKTGQFANQFVRPTSYTCSDGLVTTFTQPLDLTVGQPIFVTGPTTIASMQFASQVHSGTAVGLLPGGINNVVGEQVMTGDSMTVFVPDAATMPFEAAALITGGFANTSHWLNIPMAATDLCIAEIARRVRDNLPAGREVRVEYTNEYWNFANPNEWCYAMSALGVYGATGGTGFSSYKAYALRASQAHKIVYDVFQATGRGSEIIRVFGGQAIPGGPPTGYIPYANTYNVANPTTPIQIDEVAIAPYSDMPANMAIPIASLVSTNPLSIRFNQPTTWTATGVMDFYRHFLKYRIWFVGPGLTVFPTLNTLFATYVAAGTQAPGYVPKLCAYEGGLAKLVSGVISTGPDANGMRLETQIAADFFHNPGIYDCAMAYLQMCQQGAMTVSTWFAVSQQLNNGFAWTCAIWPGQPAGRGDGTGTTTVGCLGPVGTPVTNQFWMTDGKSHFVGNVSPIMQAVRDWIDQAATPPPTPTVPTITWAAPANILLGTPLGATQLNATANTAGTFVYTPPFGTVLPLGINTLNTLFTPSDLINWTTAPASVPITVIALPPNPQTPTITWAAPADITFGTALSITQLNATANTPGTFIYNPDFGFVPPVGMIVLQASFTPTDLVNWGPAQSGVPLNVLPVTPPPPIGLTVVIRGLVSGLVVTRGFLNDQTPTSIDISVDPRAGTSINIAGLLDGVDPRMGSVDIAGVDPRAGSQDEDEIDPRQGSVIA